MIVRIGTSILAVGALVAHRMAPTGPTVNPSASVESQEAHLRDRLNQAHVLRNHQFPAPFSQATQSVDELTVLLNDEMQRLIADTIAATSNKRKPKKGQMLLSPLLHGLVPCQDYTGLVDDARDTQARTTTTMAPQGANEPTPGPMGPKAGVSAFGGNLRGMGEGAMILA